MSARRWDTFCVEIVFFEGEVFPEAVGEHFDRDVGGFFGWVGGEFGAFGYGVGCDFTI